MSGDASRVIHEAVGRFLEGDAVGAVAMASMPGVIETPLAQAALQAFEHSPPYHPAFGRLSLTRPERDGELAVDVFGIRLRPDFERQLPAGRLTSGRGSGLSVPPPHYSDHYRLLDLLMALEAADRRFVMIEAGAGYGRWLVTAAALIRRHPGLDIRETRLVGVEPHPTRFQWLLRHFTDNDLDPADHDLINVAIHVAAEPVLFRRDASPALPDDEACNYDQGLAFFEGWREAARRHREMVVATDGGSHRLSSVAALPMSSLLDRVDGAVDLLHLDLRGAELQAVTAALPALAERVKRLHVASINEAGDMDLARQLVAAGFDMIRHRPAASISLTAEGVLRTADGIQTWTNSRFVPSPPAP
ncbi:hypothetical protein, partial [Magnetospirillum sp. SS-4]|uniref:hypothetical protein n=1 Tax=Magnetospirillum sp. SS-4 TaxID=2681465 RepID=UPI001572593E